MKGPGRERERGGISPYFNGLHYLSVPLLSYMPPSALYSLLLFALRFDQYLLTGAMVNDEVKVNRLVSRFV